MSSRLMNVIALVQVTYLVRAGRKLQLVLVDRLRKADEKQMRSSASDVADKQNFGNRYRRKEFTTPGLMLRRSKRVSRTVRHFIHFATAAIEKPVTMEEAIAISNKEQWQKAVMKKLKSIKENGS